MKDCFSSEGQFSKITDIGGQFSKIMGSVLYN